MNETLQLIRARLAAEIDYVCIEDIHIMTDSDIPESARFPAIGLKDGGDNWTLEGGTMAGGAEFDKGMTIKVFLFVEIFREEERITGDDVEKGILDFETDTITAINGYELVGKVDNYTAPIVIKSTGESKNYIAEAEHEDELEGTVYIQMKELTFTCSKQVSI